MLCLLAVLATAVGTCVRVPVSRSQSTSKKGVKLQQVDMDMAKQALQGMKIALARMKSSIEEGSLKDVFAVAKASGGHADGRKDGDGQAATAAAPPSAADAAASQQRKLTDLTRALLPSDWRCVRCNYLNSFSNGPCTWCGNMRVIGDGFKRRRPETALAGSRVNITSAAAGMPSAVVAAAQAAASGMEVVERARKRARGQE